MVVVILISVRICVILEIVIVHKNSYSSEQLPDSAKDKGYSFGLGSYVLDNTLSSVLMHMHKDI